MKDSIGIDISKAHIDVCRPSKDEVRQFANTQAGLEDFRHWIGQEQPDLVVYEATGAYHGELERRFAGDLPLIKVNPLQARRFVQARGVRAKTDRLDARHLAMMGDALSLVPDKPLPEKHYEVKELWVARTALIKDRTRLKNRLQTQKLALTRRQTQDRLKQVGRQIAALDKEIRTCLKTDPKTARAHDILLSIPGIGPVAAAAILIECPEVGTLTRKQAASLAGLAPMARQSGQWKGQAFIQGGRKFLRDALYMPALVAARFNPNLKAKYLAMTTAGKPKKLALVAIMRKLFELANALVKDNRKWNLLSP